LISGVVSVKERKGGYMRIKWFRWWYLDKYNTQKYMMRGIIIEIGKYRKIIRFT